MFVIPSAVDGDEGRDGEDTEKELCNLAKIRVALQSGKDREICFCWCDLEASLFHCQISARERK